MYSYLTYYNDNDIMEYRRRLWFDIADGDIIRYVLS